MQIPTRLINIKILPTNKLPKDTKGKLIFNLNNNNKVKNNLLNSVNDINKVFKMQKCTSALFETLLSRCDQTDSVVQLRGLVASVMFGWLFVQSLHVAHISGVRLGSRCVVSPRVLLWQSLQQGVQDITMMNVGLERVVFKIVTWCTRQAYCREDYKESR